MRSEDASIWFLPSTDNNPVILIKASTPILKSIVSGSPVELLFGKENADIGRYLCTGVLVKDAIPPVFFYGLQRRTEEHESLLSILRMVETSIFLFNELDICVAWTKAIFDKELRDQVSEFVGSCSELYVGEFNEIGSHFLDNFGYTLDETLYLPDLKKIQHVSLLGKFMAWKFINNFFVGLGDRSKLCLKDKDEGKGFEDSIWSSLECVFPSAIFKRPIVLCNGGERELTDVVTYYKYGSFLIEAKALSITSECLERSIERRLNGIQKQVKKGIAQLVGAVKNVKSGCIIKDYRGNILDFNRGIPPHCIVLVSELVHSGDWYKVETQLFEAMKTTKCFFHVLDLSDFMRYLKGSKGTPEFLDYNLIKRAELFAKKRSIHMRSCIKK
jgi:hypothetical protein